MDSLGVKRLRTFTTREINSYISMSHYCMPSLVGSPAATSGWEYFLGNLLTVLKERGQEHVPTTFSLPAP